MVKISPYIYVNLTSSSCCLFFLLFLLFTKFYRSEENKDSDIEGTGLGLAITKSLVELMDGKISVHSTYGSGTTFIINLSQKLNVDENIELL